MLAGGQHKHQDQATHTVALCRQCGRKVGGHNYLACLGIIGMKGYTAQLI
jgi:hypothetical protein